MDMIVVAVTSCDWAILLGAISRIIGRPVSRGLDSKNMIGRGLAELISALGEFHSESTDPVVAQRCAGFLLKHASVSFFCSFTPDCVHDLLVAGCVSILDTETQGMVIATATLEDWRTTVINLCAENQTKNMRLVGAKILQRFDELGLARIFELYSRKPTQSGLLLTAHK